MIKIIKPVTLLVASFCVLAIVSGCAGVQVSKFTYDDAYQVNKSMKGEKCYDASVLLGVDINRARNISKKVLVDDEATITEETDTLIKAQRDRVYTNLSVADGGEELSIKLKDVGENKTFITVATKTGFWGGAVQKGQSCQIVDEMVKMTSK